MARPRADTGQFQKEPHSVSLKVLRLSKPTFALQHPLPHRYDTKIPRTASLSCPSTSLDQEYILSTNLSLPPAFGSAHVGETFSCALCANNELLDGNTTKFVSGVKVLAEMQTPSQSVSLQLYASEQSDPPDMSKPGTSMQKIINFDLKEEGNHVLAISVSYSETIQTEGGSSATGGRVRSFRKLYQFLAQPCLSVRTKATELAPQEVADKTFGPYGRTSLLRYSLEAQLENVTDGSIVLEQANILPRPPFKAASLNWDADSDEDKSEDFPVLNPNDVLQVAFILEQEHGVNEGLEELKIGLRRDGRASLGQLSISWRGGMGERGSLSTGNLMSRRKTP